MAIFESGSLKSSNILVHFKFDLSGFWSEQTFSTEITVIGRQL